MEQLDLFDFSLEKVIVDHNLVWNYNLDGMHLIEASAGTGKTYTIMNLYLRFVLEQERKVEDILVVTFTEAATKELKDRIRRNLYVTELWLKELLLVETDLKLFLTNISESGKDVNQIIASRYLLTKGATIEAVKHAQLLVRRAVVGFDEAAVFTIHGFCQRMLNENAFESGALFDTKLITDSSDILQEVVDDFWREQIYPADEALVELLHDVKFKRSDLVTLAKEFIKNPALQLAYHDENIDSIKSRLKSIKEQIIILESERENFCQLDLHKELFDLLHLPELFKKKFADEASLNKLISDLPVGMKLFPKTGYWGKIKSFTKAEIAKAVSKKGEASGVEIPHHELFTFCQRLKDFQPLYKQAENLHKQIMASTINQFKVLFCSTLLQTFSEKKQALNVMSFEDLLQSLQRALKGDDGAAYIELIRQRFGVVMIDEFQDTDPVQYDIFSLLFGKESNCAFYMIGDPKQSIYKFRGADIFAYLQAKNQVSNSQNQHGLDTNYRSESGMIDAVNHYFSSSSNPFIAEAIEFEKVKAGGKTDKEAKLVCVGCDKSEPSLQICWVNSETGGRLKKDPSIRRVNEVVSEQIVDLISGDYEFKSSENDDRQAVFPEDIAILVTAHYQARLVQQSLAKRGIPSVLQNSGDLFDSLETVDMLHLLNAIVDPSERRIRTALITSFIGMTADEIYTLDEQTFMDWYEFFVHCHDVWLNRDFMSMFCKFMKMSIVKEQLGKISPVIGDLTDDLVGLRTRLVTNINGERALTNILHLAEVLHQQESAERLTPEGVLSWLSRRKDSDDKTGEEFLQRLESDADAVKILTVHKSKGLEFPIVFCPFMWSKKFSGASKSNDFLFYDESENSRFYDIGSEFKDEHYLWHRKEELQESLRLLYVALTRARNRCYLHWGPFNGSETTALMYLAENPTDIDTFIEKGKGEIVFAKDSEKNEPACKQLLGKLKELQERSHGTVKVNELYAPKIYRTFSPSDSEDIGLSRRDFSGTVDTGWGVGSFSSLTRNAHRIGHKVVDRAEGRDVDAVDQSDEYEEGVLKAFIDIPGGAALGSAVHEIFEQIDFTNPELNLDDVVVKRLEMYGVATGKNSEEKEQDLELKCQLVKTMVLETLDADISVGENAFKLSAVENRNRLVEMKFYFRVAQISNVQLAEIFKSEDHGDVAHKFAHQLADLKFDLTNGFMNGAIDLIFKENDKFYILDWKTTSCGKRFGDYSQLNVDQSMYDHHYILQYHIYTAALHLYLQKRIPDYDYDRDFGGSIYAYLRGVSSKYPGNGFFFDKPPKSLIEAICDELIGEGR